MAGQPGTLFCRLLTDPTGNLLDVTELGRFPSRKLAATIRFRDGVCTNPVCHVSSHRADQDHVVRFPDGPTAGVNLDPKCRSDHRGKTHAGFITTLVAGQATWITPTAAPVLRPARSAGRRGMAAGFGVGAAAGVDRARRGLAAAAGMSLAVSTDREEPETSPRIGLGRAGHHEP